MGLDKYHYILTPVVSLNRLRIIPTFTAPHRAWKVPAGPMLLVKAGSCDDQSSAFERYGLTPIMDKGLPGIVQTFGCGEVLILTKQKKLLSDPNKANTCN